MVSREPASRSEEISAWPRASRVLLSSRQMRLSSEGSTSACASSAPPETKRTMAAATASVTSVGAGPRTAAMACAPFMRARRIRFWVTEGISPFSASRLAR